MGLIDLRLGLYLGLFYGLVHDPCAATWALASSASRSDLSLAASALDRAALSRSFRILFLRSSMTFSTGL